MKIVGLITEYNPFHNGHLYHLEKAKEATGADAVVAVMSGDFVQRGAPALLPKHLRTYTALNAGVSAVIELPVWCACGSAEYFAAGAVSVLNRLGCVDAICFGSECGDLSMLREIARITADEPEEYKNILRRELKKGLSFPRARQNALTSYMKNTEALHILESPNNILGIEYIKAALRQNAGIDFCTIKRKESGYHDRELSESCSSASAIRNLVKSADDSVCAEGSRTGKEALLTSLLSRLESQMPAPCARILRDAYRTRYPVYADDLSLLLKYRLLLERKETLSRYADVTEELANRIYGSRNSFVSFSQFCDLLKTKDITYSRISRALLHILLDITSEDMENFKKDGGCGYARILGFRKDRAPLLGLLKKNSSIPLITKLPRAEVLSGTAKKMLERDIFSANLYESVVTEKFRLPFIHECRQQVVIV